MQPGPGSQECLIGLVTTHLGQDLRNAFWYILRVVRHVTYLPTYLPTYHRKSRYVCRYVASSLGLGLGLGWVVESVHVLEG